MLVACNKTCFLDLVTRHMLDYKCNVIQNVSNNRTFYLLN